MSGPFNLADVLASVGDIEGVNADPAVTIDSWSIGFLSCLDYVATQPELIMGIAQWWREESQAHRGHNLARGYAERQTQAGAIVMSEALRKRSEADDADRR